MDKYENLGVVGEGSYGIVSKVRHKPTLRIVAIKKFIESEDDKNVRKIALREVRALRKLKHDNLVALLEVFRRKKRLYLVFEYVDRTVLDELERSPNGLSETFTCKIIYQVIKGTQFMHDNSYIHRDIKPENILVSKGGVVKICDFGFARAITASQDLPETGSTKQMGSGRIQCTDYVATRWYRAPELLVGDLYYGKGVDTWAIGCLTAELSNSLPLFPGKSDLDQLHLIMMTCGELCKKHQTIFEKTSSFNKFSKILPRYKIGSVPIERTLKSTSSDLVSFIKCCLRMDPFERWNCEELLTKSACFTRSSFQKKTLPEMQAKIDQESNNKQVCLKPPQQSSQSNHPSNLTKQNANAIEINNRMINSTSRQSQHRSLCSITPFEARKNQGGGTDSSFTTYAEAASHSKLIKNGRGGGSGSNKQDGYVVKEINLPKLNKHSNQTTSKKNKPSIPQKKKLSQKLNKSTSKLNDNDHDEAGKQHLPSLTMKFIGKSN